MQNPSGSQSGFHTRSPSSGQDQRDPNGYGYARNPNSRDPQPPTDSHSRGDVHPSGRAPYPDSGSYSRDPHGPAPDSGPGPGYNQPPNSYPRGPRGASGDPYPYGSSPPSMPRTTREEESEWCSLFSLIFFYNLLYFYNLQSFSIFFLLLSISEIPDG